MKITSVTVSGCGRFGAEVRLENFGPGVNILAARNEAGKSTLFRAIRTCLFERHSAGGRDIAALATEGSSLPVSIAVGFEHGGERYEIRKSFVRSRQASLVRNGIEIARNAEADERVWDLLGISPRSARSLDEATYGLLWVQQGHSFDLARPSEGARLVLNDVIQQEVGTLVGGERARLLLAAVKEEISPLVTDTGRPRANGPYDLAIKRADSLREERAKVEEQLRDLDDSLDGLLRLRADLKRAADPAEMARLRRERDESARQLASALEAGEQLRRLETAEQQAHQLLAAQREKVDSVRERARAIDANRLQIKQLAQDLAPLDEDEARLRRELAETDARKAACDRDLESLDHELNRLQRLADVIAKAAARASSAARLAALKDHELRAAANAAALAAASVDDAAIKALESIEQDEDRLRARIEAASAQLSIELKSGISVILNGANLSGNIVRAVTEPLSIMVGDGVAITVSPPATTLAAAGKSLAEHKARLDALLARHGAASPDELRRLRAGRAALEDIARDLRAERLALAIADTAAAEIHRLETELARIDAEASRVLQEIGAGQLPSADDIASRRDTLLERRSAVRSERDALESGLAERHRQLQQLVGRRAALDGRIGALEAQLAGDLVQLPDESRDTVTAQARQELERREAEHRAKAVLLEERRAVAPDDATVAQLRARVERFTSALNGAAAESQRLSTEIARLEAKIETLGGGGIGERAAALAADLEIADAERARQEERVAVLALLRSTVERCYAKRQEQLSAPLRRHLRPFLHDVFPQAEIELDADFVVSRLKRAGPVPEDFERLSAGTREQIAVLVRLAMGAMICEKGADVPVILDDALVFSDDDRIEQMFDAINRAGRNQQVIVFTCRARSFASLGGQRLQIG
jgi:hypothetical protein